MAEALNRPKKMSEEARQRREHSQAREPDMWVLRGGYVLIIMMSSVGCWPSGAPVVSYCCNFMLNHPPLFAPQACVFLQDYGRTCCKSPSKQETCQVDSHIMQKARVSQHSPVLKDNYWADLWHSFIFALLQVLYLQQAEVTRERVYAMHQSSIDGVEDMSALAELHEAAIMHNLYQRYQKDSIYVSAFRESCMSLTFLKHMSAISCPVHFLF